MGCGSKWACTPSSKRQNKQQKQHRYYRWGGASCGGAVHALRSAQCESSLCGVKPIASMHAHCTPPSK